jgi:molybdopterin/thiamine biosynthesis adenylyltransferase
MLEQAVRAAASPLHVPGQAGTPAQPRVWQVIGPAQVEAIAAEHTLPRWQVEVAALEAEIVPLHYMRNLARFAMRGQLDLLSSAVTVVGSGLPVQKCLQILAAHGIGRLRVLVPVQASGIGSPGLGTVSDSRDKSPAAGVSRLTSPELLAGVVANQNASLQTSADTIDLRRGDPSALLGEPDFPADGWVVAACLEDAAEEMLLQVACKRRGVPLILGALQEDVGQATTILPGDPGVPLIYQADHPHLDRARPGSLKQDGYQGMIVGTWLADQVIALRLGLGEVLQNRLLYADMGSGEMQTFPLGRSGG